MSADLHRVARDVVRVAVFVDAQNVFRTARLAFHDGAGSTTDGQVDPMKLAALLVERGQLEGPIHKRLEAVHVYVGRPSEARDPISAFARARQVDAWQRAGATVSQWPLAYPDDYPASAAQEKGVDVALAVDLVAGAIKDDFDVAVVASTDNDLLPALQKVCERMDAWGRPRIEVFAWSPVGRRLWLKKRSIWCHFLDRPDYERVRDTRNYAAATAAPPALVTGARPT